MQVLKFSVWPPFSKWPPTKIWKVHNKYNKIARALKLGTFIEHNKALCMYVYKKNQDGRHFQNGHRWKFWKMKKVLEPYLVSKCIDYHSGVFYPTGIREGIYCDLLAITTLNLVIKSPTTKCRETYCFCPVSYYYYYFSFFFSLMNLSGILFIERVERSFWTLHSCSTPTLVVHIGFGISKMAAVSKWRPSEKSAEN